MAIRKFAQFSVWRSVRGRGLFKFFFGRHFALKPDQSINEIRESMENSLRSYHFRAVSEQKKRGTRVKDRVKNGSFHFSRCQHRKSRSSVFFCSETIWKRLLRRLD